MSVMVEMSLAILLSTALTAGTIAESARTSEAVQARALGTYAKAVKQGVDRYVDVHYDELATNSPVTGFANPVAPTIDELRTAGYVIPGFSSTGPMNVKFGITLTRTNCPGVTCQILGFAYTVQPVRDVEGNVRNDILTNAASQIGSDAGISDVTAGNTLVGFGNSYRQPNPAPGAPVGTFAVQVGTPAGNQLSLFYKLDGSRALTGNMNANGNSINNVDQLNAASVTATGAIGGQTVTSTGRLASGEYVKIGGVGVEGQPCEARTVSLDANGLTLSCQSGVWKRAVKAPSLYRYVFTTSQAWTVPDGVTSALVTMAGGGGSGLGWRFASQYITGHSGGFVFSAPVNLKAGETMQVIVGKGGIAYAPVNLGSYWAAPSGDDGLSGYPGGPSMLISPSSGTLLECDGGSGATTGVYNGLSGAVIIPGPQGHAWAFGPPYAGVTANRIASGPFAQSNGPGACGPNLYGVGNTGTTSYSAGQSTALTSGSYSGALTPFGYGSGGTVSVTGCMVSPSVQGVCVVPNAGRDGVVMIDVLY